MTATAAGTAAWHKWGQQFLKTSLNSDSIKHNRTISVAAVVVAAAAVAIVAFWRGDRCGDMVSDVECTKNTMNSVTK